MRLVKMDARASLSSGTSVETSVEKYAVTYVVVIVLLFFTVGGNIPTRYSSDSSLLSMADDTSTFVGTAFQSSAWIVALFLMRGQFRSIFRICLRMKAILALALLAPLSALWSQNPSISFRRGIFLVLTTLFSFYLVQRFTPVDLAKIIVIAGTIAGLLAIAVSILLPQVGLDAGNQYAWQGIFHSKNGCAQVMLFFLSAAASFRFRSQSMGFLRLFLFPLAFFLILMSNAKTGWIIAPVYLLSMTVASRLKQFNRRDATFMAVGWSMVLLVATILLSMAIPIFLSALGKDPTISGRIPLWGAVLVSILKHPLLGYGFSAFWTGLQGESLSVIMNAGFEIHQAQNGFLELALELGLVGVGLMVLSVVRALRDALVCFQHGHSDAINWYVGLVALTVAYNVDETFLARENTITWLLYLVACVGIAEEARKIRMKIALSDAQTYSLSGNSNPALATA